MRTLIARLLRLRIVRAALSYSEHRGPMLADSITYRALFSVFAAVLLGFSLAALWLGNNPDALRALGDSLNTVIPGLTELIDPTTTRASVSFTVAGVASLVALIGAAISAIGSLRAALRILSGELTDQTFVLWVLLRNLLVAIAFGGLLVLAVIASSLGTLWIPEVTRWVGLEGSGVAEVVTRVFAILVVFAIDTLAIALVFRLLSGVRAPARALWGGAVIGGIGLTVLQELSGLFVRGASANPLLASFAALIALLIWFNLSAQVILIASSYIITATAERTDRVRVAFGASTLAQRRRQRAEDAVHAATRELRDAQEAERTERESIERTEHKRAERTEHKRAERTEHKRVDRTGASGPGGGPAAGAGSGPGAVSGEGAGAGPSAGSGTGEKPGAGSGSETDSRPDASAGSEGR